MEHLQQKTILLPTCKACRNLNDIYVIHEWQ